MERRSLATQVGEVLTDRIARGVWAAGAKLPGEAALATEFGVGRSTVREAIRDLAGRGVLDTRQGAGVFVLDPAATRPEWGEILRRAAIGEVVEARLAVETEAAHRAAQRRTRADLDALENTLAHRRHAESSASDDDFVAADLEFHHAVVRAAHNHLLSELFAGFEDRVREAMLDMLALLGPGDRRPRQVHDAHAAILTAIRDGDPQAAAARSRAHLEELHERIAVPPGSVGGDQRGISGLDEEA